MTAWIDYITALWPIAATLTPLILIAGFLWLKTQFAGAADFRTVCTAVDTLRTDFVLVKAQLAQLAGDIESSPTRLDMVRQIASVSERLGRVEANGEASMRMAAMQMQALERQLAVQNNYLQALVEKGMNP